MLKTFDRYPWRFRTIGFSGILKKYNHQQFYRFGKADTEKLTRQMRFVPFGVDTS